MNAAVCVTPRAAHTEKSRTQQNGGERTDILGWFGWGVGGGPERESGKEPEFEIRGER